MLRFFIPIFCAGILLLNSFAEASKAGAVIGLPFAIMGDTVLLPFQSMGYMSTALIDQGNTSESYTQYSSFNYEYNEPSVVQLVFYIPGYILAPFSPLAQFKYYPLTSSCIETLTVNDAHRRNRTLY